jgi:hypothetical protein
VRKESKQHFKLHVPNTTASKTQAGPTPSNGCIPRCYSPPPLAIAFAPFPLPIPHPPPHTHTTHLPAKSVTSAVNRPLRSTGHGRPSPLEITWCARHTLQYSNQTAEKQQEAGGLRRYAMGVTGSVAWTGTKASAGWDHTGHVVPGTADPHPWR